ncbi:hypothetical protein BDZ89DRAFT_1163188, partial [Hymenopellis radicata]
MFNILRLLSLALLIAAVPSTAVNIPRAPSFDVPSNVIRAPLVSLEESTVYYVRETLSAKRMFRGLGSVARNFERATILPGRPTRAESAHRSTPSGSVSSAIMGDVRIME